MRSISGGDLSLIQGNFNVFHRTWIANADGTYINLGALTHGGKTYDMVIGGEFDYDIDRPAAEATIYLRRDIGDQAANLSLAPFRTDSPFNVRDDGVTFATLTDVGRSFYVETAVMALGSTPGSLDWHKVFVGTTDTANSENQVQVLRGRDQYGQIIDAQITAATTFDYTTLPGGGKLIENVIADVLAWSSLGGGGAPAVYTPTSPGYVVQKFAVNEEPLNTALQRLILAVGGDLRYTWDDGTNQFRLTFTIPNRAKTVPDYTVAPSQYLDVTNLALDRSQVRNKIIVRWGPQNARTTSEYDDATSQTRYGVRPMLDEEDPAGTVTNTTGANLLGNAILSDLKDPKANQSVEMLYFWPIQLGDLMRFSPNGVHYNVNTDLSVVHYVLKYGGQSGKQHRTTVDVRGSPAGSYLNWMARAARGQGLQSSTSAPICTINENGSKFKKSASLTFDGALGIGATGTLTWAYSVDGVAFGPFTTPLPTNVTISRSQFYDQTVELAVSQPDGQTATQVYVVQSQYDGSSVGSRTTEDDARGQRSSGVPVKGQSFHSLPIYSDDGSTAYMDTVSGKLTSHLQGPNGTFMDGVETGSNRGFGGFSDTTGSLVSTAKDSRASLVNSHFRYSVDSSDGVVDGTGSPISGGKRGFSTIDTLNRVKRGNGFDDGNYAATATNSTGFGLHASVLDSRAAAVNGMFRYSTDTSDGVVDGTGSPISGGKRGFSTIDASNRVKRGNGFDDGNYAATATNSTGFALHGSVQDSRSSLINAHFRLSVDSTDSVVEGTGSPLTGGKRGFNALNSSNALVSSIDAAATGSDGFSNVESRRGAAKQGGHAQGSVAEGRQRAGNGGLDTPSGRIATDTIYDHPTGATPLIDTALAQILSGLAIGPGVKGDSTVAFGASGATPFSPNRHNDETLVSLTNHGVTFGHSFEKVPQIRVIPQKFLVPGASSTVDREFEFAAAALTVSGFTSRTVSSTGSTTTSQTNQWAASLNGTPASSVTLTAPSDAAYCDLSHANGTLTTYVAHYDVDTTAVISSITTYVDVYTNNGTSSTSWTLVGSASYPSGVSLTDETISFLATMSLDWDLRIVLTYSSTPLVAKRASISANSVAYSVVSSGVETDIASPNGGGVLFQANEAP